MLSDFTRPSLALAKRSISLAPEGNRPAIVLISVSVAGSSLRLSLSGNFTGAQRSIDCCDDVAGLRLVAISPTENSELMAYLLTRYLVVAKLSPGLPMGSTSSGIVLIRPEGTMVTLDFLVCGVRTYRSPSEHFT